MSTHIDCIIYKSVNVNKLTNVIYVEILTIHYFLMQINHLTKFESSILP